MANLFNIGKVRFPHLCVWYPRFQVDFPDKYFFHQFFFLSG